VTDCLLWEGRLDRDGYAKRGEVYVHREVMDAPKGMEVHHLCGNRGCVEPEHLLVVNRADHLKLHKMTHCRKAGHPLKQGKKQQVCNPCAAESAREYRARQKERTK